MEDNLRSEKEIFNELETICKSPGYVHAIAYFCFRDNTIQCADKMVANDVLQPFSMETLVRAEISTLIGLTCKFTLDTTHPGAHKIQDYIDRTESLLQELHAVLMPPFKTIFNTSDIEDLNFNQFINGEVFREAIFYGGESAYNFQYRDLSLIKYKNDNDYLTINKGYSIEQGVMLASSLSQMQNDKINDLMQTLTLKHPDEWTILPGYTFSSEELADRSGTDKKVVKAFVESFVFTGDYDNINFSKLDDFNPINAYPIIKISDNNYLLFQIYTLAEALYETPFFWFNDDDDYKVQARKNRGVFTESFSEERLKIVFGENRVFTNICIYKGKKKRVGEIDVLVIYSNRAIVLQAKSKKLTIAARQGNYHCIKDDFKKAVQDAYDQAYRCSVFLNDDNYRLVDSNGKGLAIKRNFREIYPFCVVSDHYPALSFQAIQFLNYQTTAIIKPPFVMDVFFLDVLTEMLRSPLYFLSYINRRVQYSRKILSSHESTILSYHLKNNLWVDNDLSLLAITDDVCADLDLAMLTRRDGAPGIDTPDGILTRYHDTSFASLISQIENIDNPTIIDFGFMLLSLNGNAIEEFNKGLEYICDQYLKDGQNHDFTLGIGGGETGVTIHCNSDANYIAGPRLSDHCKRRKYISRANTWFGLCVEPVTRIIRFCLELKFNWKQSGELD